MKKAEDRVKHNTGHIDRHIINMEIELRVNNVFTCLIPFVVELNRDSKWLLLSLRPSQPVMEHTGIPYSII